MSADLADQNTEPNQLIHRRSVCNQVIRALFATARN